MIGVGGWDGILDIDEENQFIPNGKSGWEFGTDSNVNKKADGDYQKRTTNPKPIKRGTSTFVFVTSRLWTKKNSWVADKKKQRKWKKCNWNQCRRLRNMASAMSVSASLVLTIAWQKN